MVSVHLDPEEKKHMTGWCIKTYLEHLLFVYIGVRVFGEIMIRFIALFAAII